MAHHHHHHHQHSNNIKVAFFLNLSFTIIEIIGGLMTNSMAILSDALHDLGDSLSLGIAWFLEKVAGRKADDAFTFGYGRFSLLGALINSLVIVIGSFFILYHTVPRLLNPEPVHAPGMLFLSIIGITINGLAVLRLKRGTSLNERVVSWHLMEDVLGWVVVLIASVILLFVDAPIIDPILSLLIMGYILYKVYGNLKEIVMVFLQAAPRGLSKQKIINKLEQTLNASVHHVHLWSLEGEKVMLSLHLVLPDDATSEEIIARKETIRTFLKNEGVSHITIEVEFENEQCRANDCS